MNCALRHIDCNSIHGAKREIMAKPIHDASASIHLQKTTEARMEPSQFFIWDGSIELKARASLVLPNMSAPLN